MVVCWKLFIPIPLKSIKDISKYFCKLDKSNYLVMMAVCDEGSLQFDVFAESFSKLGFKNDLKGKFQWAFIGVLDGGKVIYEDLQDAPLSYEYLVDNKIAVKIISEGWGKGNKASILVNGAECALNKRGFNIVVYNKSTKEVIDSVVFDTFSLPVQCIRHGIRHGTTTKFIVSMLIYFAIILILYIFYPNKNKRVFTISIFYFLLMLSLGSHVFEIDFNRVQSLLLYVGMRVISLFVIIFIGHFIYRFYYNLKNHDNDAYNYFKFFLLYWIPMSIIFLIIYPGHWPCDTFCILHATHYLQINYWQHKFTSIFYRLSLCIIPLASGIVLIEYTLASIIVAYIIGKIYKEFIHNKLIYLFYIPFFMFPIIYHNFFPLRQTIVAYLFLLLLFNIFLVFKKKLCLTNFNIIVFSFLIAVISCWRSENFFLIVFIPFMFCTILKIKKLIMLFSITLILFFLGTWYQNSGNNVGMRDYNLLPIVHVLASLLSQDDISLNSKNNYLPAIDKQLNVQFMQNYGRNVGVDGGSISKFIRENISPKEKKEFLKATSFFILENFKPFIKIRIEEYLATGGYLMGYMKKLGHSHFKYSYLYGTIDCDYEYYQVILRCYPDMVLYNKKIVKFVDAFLAGWSNAKNKVNFIRYIFWFGPLLIFPIIQVILFTIFIIKRQWFFLSIEFCLGIQWLMVFFTSVAVSYMYYLPYYLCNAFFNASLLVFWLNRRYRDYVL
jgi:hypothetical protein